jgi:ABC-type nickel/cobalt efflux system permease component RcnA
MSDEIMIKEMLKQHIEDSNAYRKESQATMVAIQYKLSEINTHHEYTQSKLKDHEACIKELKDARSQQKGAIWVFGLIGLGGLIELVKKWVE